MPWLPRRLHRGDHARRHRPPIASVTAFTSYSDGLKSKSGEVWSDANLNAFLVAPATFAPGTLMVIAVTDAQQRADVIAYIASLPPPRQ